MDSKIELNEEIINKDRVFGSALSYFPCEIITKRGDKKYALFTKNQIDIAIKRAERNPEDKPEKTLWGWLFG